MPHITRAEILSNDYNTHPEDHTTSLYNMESESKTYFRAVWETVELDIFLFNDSSMIIIPEADTAKGIYLGIDEGSIV